MTPTLLGRFHTRVFLFLFVGIPVTALFAWIWFGFEWSSALFTMLLGVLVTVTAIGILLDPIYIIIQRLRWDRDWPFAYQLFFSWIEFGITLLLVRHGLVPLLPDATSALYGMMTAHFASVFVPSFLALLGPLQVLSQRWRFNAGQFGRL